MSNKLTALFEAPDRDDDLTGEEKPAPNAFDGEHLLVAESPCDQCLFSSKKLVDEPRKRDILRECYVKGTYFICHEASIAGRAVICHNFAKSKDGAGNQAIRVATWLGAIKYVDPACPDKPQSHPSEPIQSEGSSENLDQSVSLTRIIE